MIGVIAVLVIGGLFVLAKSKAGRNILDGISKAFNSGKEKEITNKKIKELSRKIDELLKENKILKEKKDKPLKAVEELKKKHIELQKRINQKSDSIETGKNIGDKGQSTNRGDSLPIDQSKNVIWKAVLEKLSPEDQQMLKKALNEENFSESTTSKKGVSHDKFDEKLMIQPINERHRKADQVSRINLNEQKKQSQGRISSIKR